VNDRYSPVVKKAQSGQQFRKCVKKVAMGMMIRAEVGYMDSFLSV